MARSKPYTKKLLVLDLFLSAISSGAWLLIIFFREIYRHGKT